MAGLLDSKAAVREHGRVAGFVKDETVHDCELQDRLVRVQKFVTGHHFEAAQLLAGAG